MCFPENPAIFQHSFFIKHLQTAGFEIGWFYVLVSRKDSIIYQRIFSVLSVTLIFE